MKKILSICLVIIMFTLSTGTIFATSDNPDQPEVFYTRTGPTSWDGARRSNDSTPRSFQKEGYFINAFSESQIPSNGKKIHKFNLHDSNNGMPKNDWLNFTIHSMRGSENYLFVETSDYYKLIPGVYFPTKIKVWVHARSPKGKFGVGTGWTEVNMYLNFYKKIS